MHLHEITNHSSDGPYGKIVRAMVEAHTTPPGIMYLLAFCESRSEILTKLTGAVMGEDSSLDAGRCELIAALTSSENQCVF